MTQKRGRSDPPRKHEPHRYGPEGSAFPPPGPSSHRLPCVAGLLRRRLDGNRVPARGRGPRCELRRVVAKGRMWSSARAAEPGYAWRKEGTCDII
jgi:hypothetical protein